MFIGKSLNYNEIQKLLDSCLLNDEEMEMGPKLWQESWYDSVDRIKLPTKLYVDDNIMKLLFPQSEPLEDLKVIRNIAVVNIDEDCGEDDKVEFHSVSITTITPHVASEFMDD